VEQALRAGGGTPLEALHKTRAMVPPRPRTRPRTRTAARSAGAGGGGGFALRTAGAGGSAAGGSAGGGAAAGAGGGDACGGGARQVLQNEDDRLHRESRLVNRLQRVQARVAKEVSLAEAMLHPAIVPEQDRSALLALETQVCCARG